MTYLLQFKRDFFIWWGCRKLNPCDEACKRLAEDVARRSASDEITSFRIRRKAALRHTPKEWA